MLWKDWITSATDGYPQARKLLGTIGEDQAETDVLDKLQRRSFIMDAQPRQPTEAVVTLFLQRFKIVAHDVVIPSPSGITLKQAACASLLLPGPDAYEFSLAVPCDQPGSLPKTHPLQAGVF